VAERIPYEEFGLFHENAAEYGLDFVEPRVERTAVDVGAGRRVSGLRWGDADPALVLLHGGAQNAHTWDTVALALDVPLVALDLPGHGHSDWRDDGRYDPVHLAADVSAALDGLGVGDVPVVGMSLGGLTAMVLAARHRRSVGHLVMVDITPGVDGRKAKAVIDFVDGPQSFASFDDLLARTIEHHPTRSESSLRRGILHNARQLDDGSWQWRYDRRSHAKTSATDAASIGPSELWEDVSSVATSMLLVRGGISPVVDDADVAEVLRRQPGCAVEVVDGAGHSVQGDRPLELATLLRERVV
jgi:pimeloyl-ACP methyl ester carboxylesterase